MNHYPRHVGDITRATFGLSPAEFGTYDRLIDWYYAEERPIPLDVDEQARITGARSAADGKAIAYVLHKFFTKQADGWHQKRCDEEIASFKEGDADRELRAKNEQERTQRHREERHRLFAELRQADVIPKWDTSIADLRKLHERTCNAPATRTGAEPATEQERTTNAPATANHKPVTSTHIPKKEKHKAVAPPDWLNPEAWQGYVDMRRRIGKPLTDRAMQLAIAKLDVFRGNGHDPGAVLDASTAGSWTGLYEPKQQGQSRHETRLSTAAEIQRMAGDDKRRDEPRDITAESTRLE